MKIKVTAFDALFLFFTLALFFSLGFGLGRGRSESIKEALIIELTLSEKKGSFGNGETMLIDGRIAADLIYLSEGEAHIRAEATLAGAGWLLSSGKYISENQPIKFYSDTSYLEGRIKRISKSPKKQSSMHTFMKIVQKNKVFL